MKTASQCPGSDVVFGVEGCKSKSTLTRNQSHTRAVIGHWRCRDRGRPKGEAPIAPALHTATYLLGATVVGKS